MIFSIALIARTFSKRAVIDRQRLKCFDFEKFEILLYIFKQKPFESFYVFPRRLSANRLKKDFVSQSFVGFIVECNQMFT